MAAKHLIYDKIPEWEFATSVKKRENIEEHSIEYYQKCLMDWIPFWRENPHRFALDYLKLNLKQFQQEEICSFAGCTTSFLIASRGIGKSFLTAVYACTMAILYPGSKIVIVCGVQAQAKNFISEKIEGELLGMCPMLRKEFEGTRDIKEVKYAYFRNGSTICATNASENRRGMRATILIVDEAVWVDREMYESVCKPFTTWSQQLPFHKYHPDAQGRKHQVIFLTSAYYKSHWFYRDYYIPSILEMINGKSTYVANHSIQTAIDSGLMSQEVAEDEISKLDPIHRSMEYQSIFYGEGKNSFFTAEEINKCRKLLTTFNPPTSMDYIRFKDSKSIYPPWKIHKEPDEIRVLSADIAVSAGKANDNSVYILYRMYKDKNVYTKTVWIKEVCYIEAVNGMNSEDQALRIKQLFYDFECDRCIIDAHGIGLAVYDELKKETIDSERGETYPKWGAYNDDNVIPTLIIDDRHYVLYAMKASAEINHVMVIKLKDDIITQRIVFPMEEREAKTEMEGMYQFSSLTGKEQAQLIRPFAEMSLAFMEMVNLSYTFNNGKIAIKEKGRNRKDRYSSLAYGTYLLNSIIDEMEEDEGYDDFIFFS